jgi:4-amino-4-deoxy-L-arabinose transferase-like glycosyltransferase
VENRTVNANVELPFSTSQLMSFTDQLDMSSQPALGASVVISPMRMALDDNRDRAAAIPKSLALILVVGFVLRLALLIGVGHSPQLHGDEPDYNQLAVNLVEHGEYAFRSGDPNSGPLVLTSLRPPLYPAFVAGIYQLFGLENWLVVGAIQTLLSLGTVWIVYRLGMKIYSAQVGVCAAALVCFYPSLLGYNNFILAEGLFTFLLCATLLALVRSVQVNSLPAFGVSGVLLGLAALTRSVVWLLPVVLGLYLLAVVPGGLRRRFAAASVMCAAFAATIAPWAIRNSRLQETFVAIDVMGGRNLMMGNYEFTPLYRSWDAISVQGEHSWVHVLSSKGLIVEGGTQGKLDKIALRYGLAFMVAHPGLTLERSLAKFFNFWQLERELIAGAKQGEFGTVSSFAFLLLALLIAGTYVGVMFAGIFGAVICAPNNLKVHGLLLLVIAFVCGMHTIVFGHSRYHLPLMPIVFIYSAAAILRTGIIWRQRWSGHFLLASLLCFLLLASWAWELFWVDPQRYLSAL